MKKLIVCVLAAMFVFFGNLNGTEQGFDIKSVHALEEAELKDLAFKLTALFRLIEEQLLIMRMQFINLRNFLQKKILMLLHFMLILFH